MQLFEHLLKVLADEKRLRIVMMLEARPMCVCEMAAVLGVTQPSVSRHLNRLLSAGLLGCRKSGFWTDYFLTPEHSTDPEFLRVVVKRLQNNPKVLEDIRVASTLDRSRLCACATEEKQNT